MRPKSGNVILAGAILLGCVVVQGQSYRSLGRQALDSTSLALTYFSEHGQVAPGRCGCFWFNGGGVEAFTAPWKGWGAAASLTGEHASTITPGVDVNLIEYMAGPRFSSAIPLRFGGSSKHAANVFGQAQIGGVEGVNGIFPGGSGFKSSAWAFGLKAGGGLEIQALRGFAIRVLEVDYLRTTLPNAASGTQNDFRLTMGITRSLYRPSRQ